MKKIVLLLYLLPLLICTSTYAQSVSGFDDCVEGNFESYIKSALRGATSGSASDFYNNLRTWIPYCDSEPLRNPPITTIEISFHVFLDNNGQNSYYTNTSEGKERLLYIFDRLNRVYSGELGGPSDPVSGVIELPN